MKKQLRLCGGWLMALVVLLTPLLVAADITPLHFFDTFTEGDTPYCELLITNGWIYGTTSAHGTNGNNSAGTVFKLSTTGTSLTVLKTFSNTGSNATPHDLGGLTLGGDILYGTTAYGVGNGGTVFKINTDGTGFETLYAFNTAGQSFPDGILPEAGLLLLGDTLYGTTYNGGLGGNGTLFKIGTNGTGYAQLKQFTNNYPANGSVPGVLAGTHPGGALATDGTYIFGTTHQGGTNFYGVIYRIGTDGNGFAVLRSFDGLELGGSPDYGVICDGSTLYGVAGGGTLLPGIGSGRGGVVFKMNTDGSGYAVLHSFTNKPDGKTPTGKLLLLGHTLYGVTSAGGTNGTGFGTVYQVNTDGSGYAILHHFTNSVPGLRTPVNVGLSAAGGQLFGVARFGGPNDGGGIFTLAQPATESAAPLLHIAPLSGAVLLTWPTNASGFLLETNATLDLPNTWSVLTSNYGVIDTNYAVTSSIDRPVQLFRLYQP